MSSEFDGLVVVPAGPGALERATLEAVLHYGLDVELNQVGWDPADDTISFEVIRGGD